MINADQSITIFNLRYDSASRREVFLPTGISGVSFCAVRKQQDANGIRTEDWDFKIRIPIDADVQDDRAYIDADSYAKLDDDEAANYWTLQTGCYICAGTPQAVDQYSVLSQDELEQLQKSSSIGQLITVREYADNTQRGSKAVRHWRIGGA